jgi:hypothetical protein
MQGYSQKLFDCFTSVIALLCAVSGLYLLSAYTSELTNDYEDGEHDEVMAQTINSMKDAFALLSLGVLVNLVQCVALVASTPVRLASALWRKSLVVGSSVVMFLTYPILLYLNVLGVIQISDDRRLTLSCAQLLVAGLCAIFTLRSALTPMRNMPKQTPLPSSSWPTLLQQGRSTLKGFHSEPRKRLNVFM